MGTNFALTGAAGYIAPRHLKAIREVGGEVVAALDPHDAVGILDQSFPQARFFVEFERFDRHLEKLRRQGEANRVHYLSICSPNYLHDAHIRSAFRLDADAICEKPLVLNPWNLDALEELERETGRKVFTLLQLRVHSAIRAVYDRYSGAKGSRHKVRLTYITSRGNWYLTSWKGDVERSGGLATNIGIHFFDMLLWIFGPAAKSEIQYSSPTAVSGTLELANADVEWFLSIDAQHLPAEVSAKGQRTFRSLTVDGQEVEFSDGFTDLHTTVYRNVLSGEGARISDARPSIELAHRIRSAVATGTKASAHPFVSELKLL